MARSVCRTITRPAVFTEHLSLTAQGHLCYCLKTPYPDGTKDVVLESLDSWICAPAAKRRILLVAGVVAVDVRVQLEVASAARLLYLSQTLKW